MGDINPLSYHIAKGATVTPGSILVAQAPNGSVGGWVEPPTVDLIDPTNSSLAMANVVTAYNQLIWGLASASVIKSDPVIEFGAAGDVGINISVESTTGSSNTELWKPGSTTKLTITEIIAKLNELCGLTSGVTFRYISGRRPYLYVADKVKITFLDPDRTTRPDTAAHIINRILKNISSGIDGPMSVVGNQITEAFSGVYSAPARVTNISCIPDISTIDVSWTASSDAVKYFVRIVGEGLNDIVKTTDTKYKFENLTSATNYNITVIASSLYELSVGDSSNTVHTTTSSSETIPNIVYQVADNGSNVNGIQAVYGPGPNLFGVFIPSGSYTINGIYFPESIFARGGTVSVKFQVFNSNPTTDLIAETNSVEIKEPSGFYTSQGYDFPKEWQTAHFKFPTNVTLTSDMVIVCVYESGSTVSVVNAKSEFRLQNQSTFPIRWYRYDSYSNSSHYNSRESYIYALTS